jgi:acetyltransferase-like isoleucine patch superfamily enzyme
MTKKSITIGNKVIVYEDTVFTAFDDRPIIIGNSSFINQRCLLGPNVTIGENVSLGHHVSLITATHDIGNSEKRAGTILFKEINIGDGSWIGANTTILPGVTLGKGCIIAAGSVVNKNCECNSLYGGVPARFIKRL